SLSFFFQAEDGIRDRNVTGVQTCALPISVERDLVDRARLARADLGLGLEVRAAGAVPALVHALVDVAVVVDPLHDLLDAALVARSEERRVGKEGRAPWAGAGEKDTRRHSR